MAHTVPVKASQPPSLIARFFIATAAYSFALLNLSLYLFLSLRSGAFFKKPTEQEQLRLAISRDKYWNLSKQPLPGYEHAFFTTRTGCKLHYLTNRPHKINAEKSSGNLLFLIHGFPDSSMIWRYCLTDPEMPIDSARIVVLDMPNYGGSDALDKPDTLVLEAITEFIVAIREQYQNEAADNAKEFATFIAAHDWGCVVAYRLAAEAPQLADRFILTNGPHIGLTKANKDRVVGSASKIFKQFWDDPKNNFRCLPKAFETLMPLLRQLVMSGYIFVFNLPRLFVAYLGSGGNQAFYAGVLKLEHRSSGEKWDRQDAFAAILGPGVIEAETKTTSGEGYGKTIPRRAGSIGEIFWQQTAFYRHGLGFLPWDKSLETVGDLYNIEADSSVSTSPLRKRSTSSAGSGLLQEFYEGALKAPATILWGAEDKALSTAICLDGISDYLAKESEVIMLPRTEHWTPVEKESRTALTRVLAACAAAKQDLPTSFVKEIQEVYEGATVTVRR